MLDGGEAGCGIVVEGSNEETKLRLGNDASSTQSEIFAILVALKKISNKENNAIIISDSQSAILSIHNRKVKCKLHQKLVNKIHKMIYKIEKKNNKIVIMWIPSHIGINGNERADKAAKEGAMKKEIDYVFGVSRDQYKRIICFFTERKK